MNNQPRANFGNNEIQRTRPISVDRGRINANHAITN